MNFPKSALRVLLGKRLPTTSGELHIPHLNQPVTIRRDAYGIPYIQAQTEIDAYFALGFCQGQDRAFQLEMLLRICRGTISELIGETGLSMDRLSRRLGYNRYAHGHYDLLEPPYQQFVDSFAQGINAGSQYGCSKLPHEFTLLRAKPTPWTGVDVMSVGNYVAFNLSSWTTKLTRLLILKNDGAEALQAIDPAYPDWQMVTKPVQGLADTAVTNLTQDLAQLLGILGLNGGSNNWVMNTSRTATGRPILANDPHLAPSIPAPWYLAHVEAPGVKVAGANFVGVPNIPSGHNEVAAWGVTASVADNIDLFIEELGPDGQTVREGDEFIPCQILDELIPVKGQDPVHEKIIVTPRGPIISDVLDDVPDVIAFKATWMSPQAVAGLMKIHTTTDFDSFRQAASQARIVSQNFVYADTANNIGWQFTTDVPQRGESKGTIPLPGWDARFHWQAPTMPWDEMPNLFNPDANFIATANQKPVRDGDGPYLGQDFIDGYRHARIVELLAARDDWDVDSTRQMQSDQFVIPWREMKSFVLQVPATSERAQTAQNLLRDWDGVAAADSAATAVYEYFVLEMVQRMIHAQAPQSGDWALGKGFHPLILRSFFMIKELSLLVQNLREQPDDWFADGWSAQISAALAGAIERLEKDLGPTPDNWRWGDVHQLVLAHPLGVRSPLDKIFNLGPIPTGGDHQTIAQAGRLSTEFGSNVSGLANLRAVYDVGNWDNNRIVIAGGQSGNPFSPHYDDLLEYWQRGEAITMPWSDDAIQQAAQQVLHLRPS